MLIYRLRSYVFLRLFGRSLENSTSGFVHLNLCKAILLPYFCVLTSKRLTVVRGCWLECDPKNVTQFEIAVIFNQVFWVFLFLSLFYLITMKIAVP